jgi:hypothetical protein
MQISIWPAVHGHEPTVDSPPITTGWSQEQWYIITDTSKATGSDSPIVIACSGAVAFTPSKPWSNLLWWNSRGRNFCHLLDAGSGSTVHQQNCCLSLSPGPSIIYDVAVGSCKLWGGFGMFESVKTICSPELKISQLTIIPCKFESLASRRIYPQ